MSELMSANDVQHDQSDLEILDFERRITESSMSKVDDVSKEPQKVS